MLFFILIFSLVLTAQIKQNAFIIDQVDQEVVSMIFERGENSGKPWSEEELSSMHSMMTENSSFKILNLLPLLLRSLKKK